MQPLVRQAAESDLMAILSLWRELMDEHADLDPRYRLVPGAGAQVEARLRAELAAPDSLLAVAEYDGVVVAYCRAAIPEQSLIFERSTHGFVSEFHVARAFRRRGIGGSLFRYVRQWFGEQGVARIELFTLDANGASNAFWQSMGCNAYSQRREIEIL